jgi:hypothetical protein
VLVSFSAQQAGSLTRTGWERTRVVGPFPRNLESTAHHGTNGGDHLKSELVWRTVFYTRHEADQAIGRYIDGFYNCSSQRTSRYVVEENRFCWAASGNAECLGWVLARRARPRAAVLLRSAGLKIHGPSSKGCIASISPRSAASRRVRGATPTMAAASPRFKAVCRLTVYRDPIAGS